MRNPKARTFASKRIVPLPQLRETPPADTPDPSAISARASLNQEEKRKDEKPAQISIEEAVKFAAQVPLPTSDQK
jgi:hypothetical protein